MTLPALRSDNIIVKLEAARIALADADIKTAKNIADVAAAAEVYAARQKLGEEVEQQAYAIKIDALRRLGELLKSTPKNTGAMGIGKSAVTDGNRTLEDMGITKRTSSIAQKLAALPEKAFEEVKEGHKSIGQAIAKVSAARSQSSGKDGAPAEVKKLHADLIEVQGLYADLLEKHSELADTARELSDKLTMFETTEPDEQQKLISELQKKLQRKDGEIDRLRGNIKDLNNKCNALIRQVKSLQKGSK